MLQFDLQFYEELTVAWVRTVKFISGAFFWPTGQLVSLQNTEATLPSMSQPPPNNFWSVPQVGSVYFSTCVTHVNTWMLLFVHCLLVTSFS